MLTKLNLAARTGQQKIGNFLTSSIFPITAQQQDLTGEFLQSKACKQAIVDTHIEGIIEYLEAL